MGFVANSSASLVWSLEGLDNLIKTSFASQHWKAYNEGWNRKNTYDWCYCHRKHNFSDFFNLPRHSAKVDALFLRAPVWICGSDEITFNPRLASTGFQKIFDVQQAYQTLRVWLCNQAAPNKPIPEVSNADMIVAKGFDLKSSFRKPKDS
jgi:hypothetical protein